jgi:phosphoribosylaminoimidazolecarboxamide formyltransferase/IMP cyclohydrolase
MSTRVRPIVRALLSVSDKTGLADFAAALAGRGVALLSTGGTARHLKDAGLPVEDVANVTGFPEIMDGRVKTLHPKIHGGILAVRDDPAHVTALETNDIAPIDLVVVTLYPFEDALARGGSYEECVENIDIGGCALIRAAAKNHADVAVVVDPADYQTVLEELAAHAGTTAALRRLLAAKALARTAAYDAVIANWFADQTATEVPVWRAFAGRLRERLRYGENPHQAAAFYANAELRPGVATARQVQGKELSFNNIADTDAAYECAAEFDPRRTATVVIVKHANPCGVAEGKTLLDAYRRALACDPVSAFGGVIALNRPLDADLARTIVEIFTEVIVAPDATEEALGVLAPRKNLRLLLAGSLPDPRARGLAFRSVAGGMLVQTRDGAVIDDLELKAVTKRKPTPEELADLKFAFRVAKHVKSNAIVYAKGGATVGIGAGQMSRVDAARIAARKAADAARIANLPEPLTRGSVVASDAFFPFADGLLAAVEAGATAVIQPGGSVRDDEVIAAANERNVAMVFTGVRHFRH